METERNTFNLLFLIKKHKAKSNGEAPSDNSHLKLKCNMCDNQTSSLYDVNFKTYGVLANQGSPSTYFMTFFAERKPAGNEFQPDYIPERREISSYSNYTYYRHSGPPKVIPEVDQSPSTINVNFANAVPKTTNLKACPREFAVAISTDLRTLSMSSAPFIVLDSLAEVKDSLYLLFTNASLNLDNGLTYELLSDIYGNMSGGRLKNKLIKNSPLSDTVISALLTEYPLSHGNFKNVIQINLPVSKHLEALFYEVLKTIPQGIAKQLMELQANSPYSNTPSKYQQEIDRVTMNRQLYLNDLVMLLNDSLNNRKDDAITLLESEGTIQAEQTLIATYIADSNYTDASIKLSNIPTDNVYVADWVNLSQILISLYQQGKTIYELDSLDIVFIRDLAYKCPAGLGTSNAQSILELLYREVFPECPIELSTKSERAVSPDNFNEDNYFKDSEELGDNYPDPATNYTIIPYYLPEDVNGIIQINDIFGRLIFSFNAYSGENTIKLDTKNFAPGVYTYTLYINSKPLHTKKMLIQK